VEEEETNSSSETIELDGSAPVCACLGDSLGVVLAGLAGLEYETGSTSKNDHWTTSSRPPCPTVTLINVPTHSHSSISIGTSHSTDTLLSTLSYPPSYPTPPPLPTPTLPPRTSSPPSLPPTRRPPPNHLSPPLLLPFHPLLHSSNPLTRLERMESRCGRPSLFPCRPARERPSVSCIA
jgi:hypothetical protein